MRFSVVLFVAVITCLSQAVPEQASAANRAPHSSVVGLWLTEDQDAVVELYLCGKKICGRFHWIGGKDHNALSRDTHNPDPAKRAQLLCDMQFIGGFEKDGDDDYTNGWIYNPNDGAKYSAEMTLTDANTLNVQGYVLIPLLGQSQTWTRVQSYESCKTPAP